ncbi:MAG: DUF1361 domain-containing protein [Hymenobacter sp.]
MPLSPSALRHRLPLFLVLGLSLALSFALIAVRIFITGRLQFAFLLWNLFLAAIPFGLSAALTLAARPPGARLLLPVGAVWLLFFPNAPYLVTDLFHLERRVGVPYWYDLALIMSCAWNGLMLAFASLLDMHTLVRQRLGLSAGWGFATAGPGSQRVRRVPGPLPALQFLGYPQQPVHPVLRHRAAPAAPLPQLANLEAPRSFSGPFCSSPTPPCACWEEG